MTLTPAQLAELDQQHAAAKADLDHNIELARDVLAEHGSLVGTVEIALDLRKAFDHDGACALAALALARLAGDTP